MEFLKEILGEELYAQVESKINEHNSSDSGKGNPLKIGNVNGYVEKSKYDALNEQLGGKQSELDTANTLISDLKKNNKGNEDLQAKITGYETDIADLQSQLAQTNHYTVSGDSVTANSVVKSGLSREISSSSATGLTDIYAVKFDVNDGFHGVSLTGNSAVSQYVPDFTKPGAVKEGEVEMVAATVLKNTQHAGVLRNIKIA